MADKGNDPAVIWRTMIGEMEKGFNSFGNQLMSSPEFSKVMNQAGGVAAGALRGGVNPGADGGQVAAEVLHRDGGGVRGGRRRLRGLGGC